MPAQEHDIRIISHPLCPFAHRLRLLLAAKGWRRGVDYRATDLDLASLPGWFFDISPDGAMPVLEVGGCVRSLDTDRSAEFLDELDGPSLLPPTPLARLRAREVIARVSKLLQQLKHVLVARDRAELVTATDHLFDELGRQAAVLAPRGTTFDGAFSAVDAAYGPFFFLATFFARLREDGRWQDTPRLWRWGRSLLDDPRVRGAACPDPAAEFEKFFEQNNSAFAAHIEAA